ncbi:unnamed protein product [Lupinus luteus]|uniref:Glycosyltransferase n=1 Tax=Lupinus luteus TaxID=3873 RepID=A0AAV1WYE4_LUPLU
MHPPMITTNPHAALLASPGMGHLIPMVELGKRLLTHHGFDVTIFVVTTDSSTTASQILQQTSNLSSLNIVVLPPIDFSSKPGPNPSLGEQVAIAMVESLPLLLSSIISMKLRPSTLIVDLFGTCAFPIARDFGMSTYVFFATSAWFSAVTIYVPVIDKEMEERHANNHEPLLIPGCESVRFEDTLEPFLSLDGPVHEGFLRAAENIISSDGILINTWQDLEPASTKAVRESSILGRFTKGPVYPVGPLVRNIEPRQEHEAVLRWLDGQPADSVIYVSFGSGGTMSEDQMNELAWGLELSQQRFVWVARPPMEDEASGAFFDVAKGGDSGPEYLPNGFLERTKDTGLVVPLWAPQAEILGHSSTGGFVTHCGWNSVLESILNVVPMVAWPLYAEQKMNASLLEEQLGVAVRAKVAEEGGRVVSREEIAMLVRRVMVDEEGVGMRKKLKELKHSGEVALSNLGSSYESLCQMTKVCELHVQGSKAKAQGA